MKFLLTSSGISNASIKNALVELLGKPIAESTALCIPTAAYGCGDSGPGIAYRLISGSSRNPLCELGWKSLGVLELTALPSIEEKDWIPMVERTDVLLVGGGDVLYLRNWMRRSGLANLFTSLRPEMVYVGVSAGSMVVSAHIGETYFLSHNPPSDDDIESEEIVLISPQEPATMTFVVAPGMRLVDFSLYPHLDSPGKVDASLANIEQYAAKVPAPMYALDDQSAIKVADGTVEVVSEGNWKLFTP